MQSLFLTAVFSSLMFMGFTAAFAAALGFVWVDIVKPQQLAYSIINDLPLSLVAALTTLFLFAAKDKKFAPKFGVILLLLTLLTVWVTFTASLSDFPTRAWAKWDWASKVLIFAVLIPYIFRSRVQIEAFILVFVFAASTIFFSAGIKTLLGGGGFDAYMYNRIAAVSSDGIVQYLPEWQIGGKAFHSIYFEVLGEQGIVGFALYFSIILLTLLMLRRIKKTWRNHAGMAWVVALADALTAAILVFLAGGAFVGIAYQPYIFYMVSLAVAIDQYARRAARDQLKLNGQVNT